jgi:hypothetical protein
LTVLFVRRSFSRLPVRLSVIIVAIGKPFLQLKLICYCTPITAEPYSGIVINPTLGEVAIDEQAVRDAIGHTNAIKSAAFAAVPDVIEKGRIIETVIDRGLESHYISAPIRITGVDDIVTVLVHNRYKCESVLLTQSHDKKQPPKSQSIA